MSNIIDFYDDQLFKTAGNVAFNEAQLSGRFKGGLVSVVYYLLLTDDGRMFLRNSSPAKGLNRDQIILALKNKFNTEFPNVSSAAQEALINMHFAGLAWVDAQNQGKTAERDAQEAVFKQQMAAITWFLWEEGTGPLFSLPW